MSQDRWQIAKVNCHKDPIPYIWSSTLVSRDRYDRLYEQWNNIEHQNWKTFINDMGVDVYFHDDFNNALAPKKDVGFIGYWFFQQRTDKSRGGEVELANDSNKKVLGYWHNTILIIETDKSFKVLPRKDLLPLRPFCELYFDESTNEKIKKLLS